MYTGPEQAWNIFIRWVRGLTKQCISDLLYVFLPSKSSECVLLFKPCQNFGVVLVGLGYLCVMYSPSYLFSTAFHEVSVYPKKELPFFILFTAGLCSFTAMLALLTHQFPELMGVFAKAVSILWWWSLPVNKDTDIGRAQLSTAGY